MTKFTKTIAGFVGALALASTLVGAASAATFTRSLTIGSTGADVITLQTWLVSKGYLVIPSGTSLGYFGSLTQAAVAAYQTAKGITPAAGYFGPVTRAAVQADSSMTTTSTVPGCTAGAMFSSTTGASCATTTSMVPGCVAGAMYSSTTGAACGVTASTGSTPAGITTPGVEGILTVSAGPISSSVVNVGAKNVPILTVRAQAQTSDIAVERITLDLGSNTTIYNKIYSQLYVEDKATGNVLATVPLNSSTVVQSGSDYVVNATGFSIVVPKNTYKDLTIAADLMNSIDTTYRNASYTVSVPSNGVRGTDGAGIDQYGPAGTISQAITINQSLTDNSQANVSLDASSPLANSVPATDTTNGQYLMLPVLTFDVNAQNDALHLHNLHVHFTIATTSTPNNAGITAAYLFNGSTMVQSAAVTCVGTSCDATFSNIVDGTAGASIPVNTTTAFTVKVDVTGVTTGSIAVTGNVDTGSATTIYNSIDQNVAATNGSANGNTQTVTGVGAQFTLASAPTLTKTIISQDNAGNATSSYQATFNLNVMAVGTDVTFGLTASGTPAFGTSTAFAKVYLNGAPDLTDSTNAKYSLAVNYSQPTNTTLSANSFTVTRGNSVTIPVTYTFLVKNPGSNSYALQLAGIKALTSQGFLATPGFMDTQTAWRTNVQ